MKRVETLIFLDRDGIEIGRLSCAEEGLNHGLRGSSGEWKAPMTYEQAIRSLNEAAYAAIRACKDTTMHPDVDRQALRSIARETDRLVDEYAFAISAAGADERRT